MKLSTYKRGLQQSKKKTLQVVADLFYSSDKKVK